MIPFYLLVKTEARVCHRVEEMNNEGQTVPNSDNKDLIIRSQGQAFPV